MHEEQDFTIDQLFMWNESTTVIRWLNSFDKKHQIIFANRIGELLENTELGEWKHISGIQNPADLETRGFRAKEIASSVCLYRPAWLQEKNLGQKQLLTSLLLKTLQERLKSLI